MSAHTSAEQTPTTAADEAALHGLKRTSSMKGLFGGGGTLPLASIFGNGANYFFIRFLARQLWMEDFGGYALRITLFNTVILVALAGVNTGTIKFMSEYRV